MISLPAIAHGPTEPFTKALDLALRQLQATLLELGPDTFPGDTSELQFYRPRQLEPGGPGANLGWTTGFWTGQLWLAYALTGQRVFCAAAEVQTESFIEREQLGVDLEHHDLGFLYQLTCLAADRLTGHPGAATAAIGAAERLLARYLPGAGVFQSWGRLDDPVQRGRVIVDGAMNLPLLHWAGRVTGRAEFGIAARRHLEQTRTHLVRPDGATYHTCHFDPVSGAALRHSTHQGLADDSCWARGQAWAIYGFALNHRALPDMDLLTDAMRVADYFLDHLPADRVALWDLSLAHDSGEPRDSSACAIAACGLLEIADQLPQCAQRQRYFQAALCLLDALAVQCTGQRPASGGLLRHGVYHRTAQVGVDEATLWGDYYYLEALARLHRGWVASHA